MRKLFLFFSMAALGIAMSSCLGEGSDYFSDIRPAYITVDNSTGLVYAKTLSGVLITSKEIALMEPNTFHYIAYSWDESYGTKVITNNAYEYIVYNVVVSESLEIERQMLQPIESPQEEEPVYVSSSYTNSFEAVNPLAHNIYMNNYWIFGWIPNVESGEAATAQFYVPALEEAESDVDQIIIDVRFTKIPASGTSASSYFKNVAAADMTPIINKYLNSSKESIKIKFRYHLEGQTDLHVTESYTLSAP